MRGAFLAAVLVASCGPALTQEQRAIQVAHAHAQARFRYAVDIERLPPTVEDRGDRWFITFHAPRGMMGGNAMVEIRKSDLSVLDSMADQ